jgi:hypothetical protein
MAAKFSSINSTRIRILTASRRRKINSLNKTRLILFIVNEVYRDLPVLMVMLFFLSCMQKDDSASSISSPPPRVSGGIQKDSLQQKLMDLEIEEAFWKNRVSMSRDASIDLAVDLMDSMIYLEIKGVPVRKTKIIAYQLSNSVVYLKLFSVYRTWLADPFKLIQDSISSVPKEPVFIKDLSTTPLEAFDDWTYFTRLENEGPVRYLLEFDRGLMIRIDQDQDSLMITDSVSWPELMGHWIRLVLPAIDAKAIYRAINTSSTMALRY